MRAALPIAAIVLLIASSTALADWDPGSAAKYVQLPDLDQTGIDVNCTAPYILADDFLCQEPGTITDIHIWGSWKNDYVPLGSAGEVNFSIYILSDIPAEQSPTGYSMPGSVLWEHHFAPNTYSHRVYSENLEEGWMDPPEEYIFPGDTRCYQYNFSLDAADYFQQEGTPEEPVVYWLEVQAFPADAGAVFGWKTSLDHWNDDATWAVGNEPNIADRFELRYPPGHVLYPESIDLAFALQGESAPTDLDFGDAPDPTYPTLLASDGARHAFVPGINLGNNIDTEPDGLQSPDAYGDDFGGLFDDEDGVFFMEPFSPNEGTDMFIKTSSAGVLDIWFDWAGDGSWDEPGDYVFGGIPVFAPGWTSFTVTTPPYATPGTSSVARVRFSTAGSPSPRGSASDGEVEDHPFFIGEEYLFKWERYPDITEMGIDVNCSQPYLLADDFECEDPGPITEIHIWGSWMNDYLPFGGDPNAIGFTLSMHADIPADTLTGTYSMPGEVLWMREFAPGDFACQLWRDQIEEGWLEPPDFFIFPGDHQCWHYIFLIPPEEAFLQEGTPEDPVVYWLDVQATPVDQDAFFGWKTSYRHWNDDAVWGVGVEPYFGPWSELLYVEGPMAGESIDLAFALYGEVWAGAVGTEAPPQFKLRQNMPNPFNPSTAVTYEVPSVGGHVSIKVFDVAGRLVATLVNERQTPGAKVVTWEGVTDDGHALPSGVYFCRMEAGGTEQTIKMLLMK
jgi:hypothetical protein